MAVAAGTGRSMVRAGLGFGRGCGAHGASAGGPGPESRTGGRAGAGAGAAPARILARSGRLEAAAALRAVAQGRRAGDERRHGRLAAAVCPARGALGPVAQLGDDRIRPQWPGKGLGGATGNGTALSNGSTGITNMKSIKSAAWVALLSGFLVTAAQAQEATIRKNLLERVPQLGKIDEVSKTPMPGLFEVRVGTDLFYSDADGSYL